MTSFVLSRESCIRKQWSSCSCSLSCSRMQRAPAKCSEGAEVPITRPQVRVTGSCDHSVAKMALTMGRALLVLLIAGVAYGRSVGSGGPTFSTAYTVKGTLQLPYAEISEPFQAWYDGAKNRSRIDYYDGMVKTYQLGTTKEYPYGLSYKVAPMSTYDVTNQVSCFLVNGTVNATVTIQSIFPDLTNFTKLKTEAVGDQQCDVWQMIEMVGTKKNTYTMWVDAKTQAPVQYEMMGFDSLLGSHYDKYVLNYMAYNSTPTFTDADFLPPSGLKCGGFPGPGEEHMVTMNPMQEFVHRDDSHTHAQFQHLKEKHGKVYDTEETHTSRLHIFRQNLRFINSKNRAGLSYTLAVNHLADLTETERKRMRGYRFTKGHHGGDPFYKSKYADRDIPDQWDWRLYGAVTPVKDQGVCGSCWSFGTTGTLEGALFLKTGQLIRLSQQQLIDCSWGEGNNACDGGEDFRSYDYIMHVGGLHSEDQYGPYLAQDGRCHAKNVTGAAPLKITGYVNVTSGDKEALRMAIAMNGPISVGIDASHRSLSFYANGVYYEPQCGNTEDDLDHAVLAVGYGVMNGQPYWLVKNSWSTYWGNDGYVLMSQKDNNCGVATAATFVKM